MPIKFIVSGFLTVVVALIGIGVWGWYASDDSRAEVERIRAERRLLIFCQEYEGLEHLAESRFGITELQPPVELGPDGQPVPGDQMGPDGEPPSDPFGHDPYEVYYYPDMDRLRRNAPPAVADEIAVVAAADEQAMQTQGPSAYERPEVLAAVERIMEYGDQTCR